MLFTMRIKGSRLTSCQLKKLLEFFIAGTTAQYDSRVDWHQQALLV